MWKISVLLAAAIGALFVLFRFKRAHHEEQEKQLLADAIDEGFGIGEELGDE